MGIFRKLTTWGWSVTWCSALAFLYSGEKAILKCLLFLSLWIWGPLLFSVVKTQTNLIILLGHWIWFICLLGGVTVESKSDRTYQAPSGLSSPIKLACLPRSWQLLMLPSPAASSACASGVPAPEVIVTLWRYLEPKRASGFRVLGTVLLWQHPGWPPSNAPSRKPKMTSMSLSEPLKQPASPCSNRCQVEMVS